MKKSVFTFVAALWSAFCLAQSAGYTVTGTSEGVVDGDTVYLSVSKNMYWLEHVDSAIVKDGKWQFKGSIDGCAYRFIEPHHNGKNVGLGAFILENADITVATFIDTKRESEVSGGPNGELYKQYRKLNHHRSDELTGYWMTTRDTLATKEQQAAAQMKMDSIMKVNTLDECQFALSHLPMPITNMILGSIFDRLPLATKKQVVATLDEKYPEAGNLKTFRSKIAREELIAEGAQFKDFEQPDKDGNPVAMSTIIAKNKLTLIDFWASWCGPCRAEMPHVKEAYDRFHDKGFEVVGISLDDKRDNWLKAIDDLALNWPHFSDLKGWKCAAALQYGIQAIPANILVNQDGVIVGNNLRGPALAAAIEKLLK